MRNAVTKVLILLAVLPWPGSANAQDEPPKQKVSFFAMQTLPGAGTIHLRRGSKRFEAFDLPGANATPRTTVVNPNGFITIYGEPVTDKEGKESYPVLGRVKSNPSWPEVFVVLVGVTRKDEGGYEGFAFPLANRSFPAGSLKLANLSSKQIRGLLGKRKLAFKPGQIETVRFADPVGKLIDVVFQYKEEERWARMISTRWVVPAAGRKIIFVYQDPETGRMTSKAIPIRED